MACTSTSKFCDSIGIAIECLKKIYQNIDTSIVLTLLTPDGYAIDLDDITDIKIIVSDSRSIPIATYIYPMDIVTGTIEELNTWFTNMEIKLLQTKLYPESYNAFDEIIIIDKGKIEFLLTSEVTNYLMIGPVTISVKITHNSEVSIINCFQIGAVLKNNF